MAMLCQISDTHIVEAGKSAYRLDPSVCLRHCLQTVRVLDPLPDAIVMTGDLVDAGSTLQYLTLRKVLADAPVPVFLLPGNHDDRDALRAAFPDHSYLRQVPRFCQYEADIGDLRLLALDTLVPGEAFGELCQERLDWLEAALARDPDRPTVLALHHPPFETGIEHMDELRLLAGADRLEAIVAAFPAIQAVICGHVHRTIFRRWAGTAISICPSPAHQVSLDLKPGAPATYHLEPPGFHLHAWNPTSGLVTHVVPAGGYPGPFLF